MQVRVQNLSELDFQLADARLADTADGPDLRLVPLNTEPRQVRPRASASPGKEREDERPRRPVPLVWRSRRGSAFSVSLSG